MNKILKKLYILFIVIVVFINLYNLINLQILNNKEKREKILNSRISTIEELPKRGSITTVDGSLLAIDEKNYFISIDPTQLDDVLINDLLSIISKYMKINISEVEKEIKELRNKNRKGYVFKEKVDLDTRNKLKKEIDSYKKKNKINSTLVFLNNSEYNRVYYEKEIYENIIGYKNKNGNTYGIESYYDEILTGKAGIYKTLRPTHSDNLGYMLVHDDYKETIKEYEPSLNIRLSVDSIIQNDLEQILKSTYEKTSSQAVMGIVFDIENGKIIAMNQYPKADSIENIKNLPITNLFEPGSIFKPIIVSMAINEGLVNENTLIHSDGYIKVKDRIVRDHDDTTKGTLPLTDIIAHSGNVAMVKIADMIKDDIFYNYLENFGFSSKTGIDLNYETKNRMVALKNLTEVRKSNISFGQGISTTQLQILMSLVATINGGELIKPSIVSGFYDDLGNLVKTKEKEVIRQVISKETSDKIRKMLSTVVTEGTGRGVKIKGYTIGGKTGTAQKAGEHGYEKGKYYSSFFAFFPVDKPKYAVLITVDEPKGVYYGAAVALPPAKEILEKLVKYKNIKPDKEEELLSQRYTYTEKKLKEFENIKNKKRNITSDVINDVNQEFLDNIMPNLIGFNKKQLLQVIPAKYTNVEIKGYGTVVRQSVIAGTNITNSTSIIIEME